MDISKTVGYFRVSTPRQAEDGHALERYHQQLIELGLPEHQIFWDVESGGSADRRGYNAVLDACRTWAKCVVVPCFDRFNRSSLLWEQARQEFVQLGVEFVEADGGRTPIDISSPSGILSTQIRAAFAEYQRNQNRYASLQGHKFRRQQEKASRACFGYKLVDGKLLINRDRYFNTRKTYQDIALELIDTFLEVGTCSGTIRVMCRRYWREKRSTDPNRRPQPWDDFPRDHTALRQWLSSPTLIGSVIYFPRTERREIPNAHEPLITLGKWQQVQEALKHSSSASRTGKLLNPLHGLLYCAGCKSPMRVRSSRSQSQGKGLRYDYLICSGAYPRAGKKRVCQRRSSFGWTIEKLEGAVIRRLIDRADLVARRGFEGKIQTVGQTPEIMALEMQLRRLQTLEDPDLIETIRLKQTRLQSLKAKADRDNETGRLNHETMQWLAAQGESYWDTTSLEDRRDLYLYLIDRIEMDKKELALWFKA